jgi:hypothetical protein
MNRDQFRAFVVERLQDQLAAVPWDPSEHEDSRWDLAEALPWARAWVGLDEEIDGTTHWEWWADVDGHDEDSGQAESMDLAKDAACDWLVQTLADGIVADVFGKEAA